MSEPQVQTLPLQGKHILVTRTREQASVFSERLRTLGAVPVEFPTIRIVPPPDWSRLDAALNRLFLADVEEQPYYDWLIYTSANGVTICCERLSALGHDVSHMSNVRIAAIGPATAATLERYGLRADIVPDEYIAEGVAAALLRDARERGVSLAGQRVLLARAAEARKILVTELQQAGALVDEVAAYYTLAVAGDDARGQEVLRLLRARQLDMLTFTSSSTVRNFMHWLRDVTNDEERNQLVMDNPHLTIACIGPITAQTARELGLHVTLQAQEFTIDGLVEAIVQTVQS